jgi:hypothetical protein
MVTPRITSRTLREFNAEMKTMGVGELAPRDRLEIVKQALTLIEQIYVHLPLKRAIHATDPVQRLRLLRHRLETTLLGAGSEIPPTRRFHDEMLSIFTQLRDLHTTYMLPEPYQKENESQTAFLPFLIEEYFTPLPNQERRYLVSKVFEGFVDGKSFRQGVDVVDWNGIPIDRAIELNADREAGSNEEARRARGIQTMTIRPLAWSAAPDEEWVLIGYNDSGRRREIRFDWRVFLPTRSPRKAPERIEQETTRLREYDSKLQSVEFSRQELQAQSSKGAPEPGGGHREPGDRPSGGGNGNDEGHGVRPTPPPPPPPPPPRGGSALASILGIDKRVEIGRRARKILFAPEAMEVELRGATLAAPGAAPAADPGPVHSMPDVFTVQDYDWPPEGHHLAATQAGAQTRKKIGYIRVWTFDVDDADAFVDEFVRIASDERFPDGLILDVRGNGGGLITAGEFLLQVLTPARIEPERFQFINSPLTLELCQPTGRFPDLERWGDSIGRSVTTGEIFSRGLPLADVAKYNDRGQTYHGPVALIVDALCYSSTDIFAAGFQDHGIGLLLGTSTETGAGGANVWTHELLRQAFPGPDSPFTQLPGNASFRVAVRRSTRIGAKMGDPLEDLGVVIAPENVYRMTKEDLLGSTAGGSQKKGNEGLIAWAAEKLSHKPVHGLSAEVAAASDGPLMANVKTRNIDELDVLLDGRPWMTVDLAPWQPSGDDGRRSGTIRLPDNAPKAGLLELRGHWRGELVATLRRRAQP